MARLYPFRALRYDPARVNMEAVVTQPYDKITPAMQQRYYEASPYNLIRVILGKHEPGDTEHQEFLPPGEKARNAYTRAYPSLHLSWTLDDRQKLTASYSHRVQRQCRQLVRRARQASVGMVSRPVDLVPAAVHVAKPVVAADAE